MFEAELEVELGYAKGDRKNKQTDNQRNGYTSKKVKIQFGEMQIEVARDRKGEF
nr:transposase [Caloranaerobacter azorensis]